MTVICLTWELVCIPYDSKCLKLEFTPSLLVFGFHLFYRNSANRLKMVHLYLFIRGSIAKKFKTQSRNSQVQIVALSIRNFESNNFNFVSKAFSFTS